MKYIYIILFTVNLFGFSPILCFDLEGKASYSYYTNATTERDIWFDLKKGNFLENNIQIKTGENSLAKIALFDESQIILGKKTIVIISHDYENDGTIACLITLIHGELHGLFNLSKNKIAHIYKIPNVIARVENGSASIVYNSHKAYTIIAMHQNSARITNPLISPKWADFDLQQFYKCIIDVDIKKISAFPPKEREKVEKQFYSDYTYKNIEMINDISPW